MHAVESAVRLKEDDTTWRTGEGDWWRAYLEELA